MLARKLRATGRTDIEVTSAGVLLGHNCIDRHQYDTLGTVTAWLQSLAYNLGPKGVGVDHLWNAITGSMIGTGGVVMPISVRDGVDRARSVLGRILQRLDGSRALVVALAEDRIPPLVIHVLDRQVTPDDEATLTRLRDALDQVGAWWRDGANRYSD